jgi:hypothetical protein
MVSWKILLRIRRAYFYIHSIYFQGDTRHEKGRDLECSTYLLLERIAEGFNNSLGLHCSFVHACSEEELGIHLNA